MNTLLRTLLSRIPRGHRLRRAQRARVQPVLTDPDQDQFFTILNGEPVTYGQFNDRLADHFVRQTETHPSNADLPPATGGQS